MRSKVLVRIDRFLVKPVPVAVKMMPDAEMEPPSDGVRHEGIHAEISCSLSSAR